MVTSFSISMFSEKHHNFAGRVAVLSERTEGHQVTEWVLSMFNGTSTPKGSYSAKTGLKLPYESKQSQRQDVKSHLEKKSNSFNVQ